MARILVTGMSGVGKSTLLAELHQRGHRTVDTDFDGYTHEVRKGDRIVDHVWDSALMDDLLASAGDEHLFISGCVSNQGTWYPQFDAVALVSVPRDTLLERIATRRTNAFGQNGEDLKAILDDLQHVEPVLRETATVELDGQRSVDDLVSELEALAEAAPHR